MIRRAALVACALLLAAGTAKAQTLVLPPGTEIARPACDGVAEEHQEHCGDRIVLDATRFAVTRSAINEANATGALNDRLRASLEDCARDRARLAAAAGREPEWRIAVRWIAVGLIVGGAFVAGERLGRHNR